MHTATIEERRKIMRWLLVLFALAATPVFGNEYVCRLPNGKKVIQGLPCQAGATTTYANTAPQESAERTAERALMRQTIEDEANEKRRKEIAEVQAEIADKEMRKYQQRQAQSLQRNQQAAAQQELRLRQLEQQAAQQQNTPPPAPRTLNCFSFGGGFSTCN